MEEDNSNIKKTVRRRRVRGQKPKARFHSGILIAVCVVLFILFYMGYAGYNFFNRYTTATVLIKNDVIDTQRGNINGVIIRREELITSSGAGAVDFVVNDKERVRKGAALLQIKDTSYTENIEQNISDINETLSEYQSRRNALSASYADTQMINARIKESVEKGLHNFIGTDMSEINDLKELIASNVELRNKTLLTESNDALKEHIDNKSVYENELERYVKTVFAPNSGVVSYYMDNMEDVFSFNAIEALTEEQILKKPDTIIRAAKKAVEANVPICRVVTGNDWYLAGYADNEYTNDLNIGDAKKIYISDGGAAKTIETTVYYKRIGADKTYIVFKSTKNIIDYMDIRHLTFKLTDTEYRGLKIPNSAIVARTFVKAPDYTVKDGAVFKQTDTGSIRIETLINKSKAPPGYVYILFDFKLLAPGDILLAQTEGEIDYMISQSDYLSLSGVYKISSQAAVFVVINDEDAVSAGGYTLLNPGGNPLLSLYDKVVADGSNIYEGQIIN